MKIIWPKNGVCEDKNEITKIIENKGKIAIKIIIWMKSLMFDATIYK